jgi:hypothetical protein
MYRGPSLQIYVSKLYRCRDVIQPEHLTHLSAKLKVFWSNRKLSEDIRRASVCGGGWMAPLRSQKNRRLTSTVHSSVSGDYKTHKVLFLAANVPTHLLDDFTPGCWSAKIQFQRAHCPHILQHVKAIEEFERFNANGNEICDVELVSFNRTRFALQFSYPNVYFYVTSCRINFIVAVAMMNATPDMEISKININSRLVWVLIIL